MRIGRSRSKVSVLRFSFTAIRMLTVIRKVIQWLLQHDPTRRPTAIQLSQSHLLPARVEDEYFKAALNVMSEHRAVILRNLNLTF